MSQISNKFLETYGLPNGIATLDSGGKVPVGQLPSSVIEYKGTWSAATNTPTLANGVGNTGDVYINTAVGTVNFGAGPITFAVGDWAIYDGSVWQKSINSNAVASVNGFTGIVSLTTTDIPQGSNLYFTDAAAQGAITGGASSITTSNLTVSKALVSDGSGKVAASTATAAAIAFVDATSSIQTQLNNKQPLDATLTSLAAYNTNGLVTQTSADTFTGRTVTAGSSKITVSNGDGVAGNPTVDVAEANLTVSNMGGTLGLTHGGTGQTSKTAAFDALAPSITKGDIAVFDGTNNVRRAVGSNGDVLTADSAQATGVKWAAPAASTFTPPTVQVLNSTGTQTGWVFTVTSANATVGATYTNNSNTFTVQKTITGETILFMSGTGATTGGTLTKSSGTGDSTITFSAKVASATYTTPVSPAVVWLEIKMVGGGGGGGGSGSGVTVAATAGTASYFSVPGMFALGGGLGSSSTAGAGGGTGGTAGNIFLNGRALTGGAGGGAQSQGSVTSFASGATGGISALGGAGAQGAANANGGAAKANTGSGGGGAGGTASATTGLPGAGGGAGGYLEGIIGSPAATYAYVVGTSGTMGIGTSFNGGAGADGSIFIIEHYS